MQNKGKQSATSSLCHSKVTSPQLWFPQQVKNFLSFDFPLYPSSISSEAQATVNEVALNAESLLSLPLGIKFHTLTFGLYINTFFKKTACYITLSLSNVLFIWVISSTSTTSLSITYILIIPKMTSSTLFSLLPNFVSYLIFLPGKVPQTQQIHVKSSYLHPYTKKKFTIICFNCQFRNPGVSIDSFLPSLTY